MATKQSVYLSGCLKIRGHLYPYSGFGRINLASLFAETCLQATHLASKGRAGMVLPSGIATDSFTQHLFNAIADGNLASLYDFENREAIFSGVHRSYKFCLLTLGRSEQSQFQFFAAATEDLTDARRRFQLSPADFALLNPNTRTCPVFRSQADAELTKKLYRATPVLWQEELKNGEGVVVQDEHNPWGLQFQLMFMMNTDSGLFKNSPAGDGEPTRSGTSVHCDHRSAVEGWLSALERGDARRRPDREEGAGNRGPTYDLGRSSRGAIVEPIASISRTTALSWHGRAVSAQNSCRNSALDENCSWCRSTSSRSSTGSTGMRS